jgi:TolB-like protein/DNA-binding winged helix-turn-helix (wHTH) protein
MQTSTAKPLRVGDWCVDPGSSQISRGGETIRVEARTMRLLLCLCERAGQVVSVDELLDRVWSGVIVTPDSVYQAVASLRRLLGDDAKQPGYIATVPRLGYRLVALVSPWVAPASGHSAVITSSAAPEALSALASSTTAPKAAAALSSSTSGGTPTALAGASAPLLTQRHRANILLAAGAALGLALLGAASLLSSKLVGSPRGASPGAAPDRSVAVLPFLDLTTQQMSEEYFADGLTEELIDQLSKVPGLKVPPATSSFYFKGKRITIPQAARSLGVAYVLDGSIRKSDTTLRVAARLVRATDGYVMWSQTYDRPYENKLAIQEEISSQVAKALSASIQ